MLSAKEIDDIIQKAKTRIKDPKFRDGLIAEIEGLKKAFDKLDRSRKVSFADRNEPFDV